MSRWRGYVLPVLVIVVSSFVAWCAWPSGRLAAARPPLPLVLGTSPEDLEASEARARARLAADAADAAAAVRLAEILLRRARVDVDGRHAVEAEQVLKDVLQQEPVDYAALKLLGAVYLSQHRFAAAADVATRAMAVNPRDAWNYGVLGDAYIELGRYDEGFDAFETMVRLRPDAASYGRVAYAHELQGRLGEALRHMRMAAEATSAHDPESLAWHYAQAGNLLFQMGQVEAAAVEFHRADHVFPNHPYARGGLARVAAARGHYTRALALYRSLLEETPTPELAAAMGDLLMRIGDTRGADEMYARAEALERDGWKTEAPQPAALARMLAERGRKIPEAVALAEEAAHVRADIFTMDTLAWAYAQAGRLEEGRVAAARAMRTGTADRRIRCHAAAIEQAAHNGRSAVNPAQCRFEQWITEVKAE
jgi:tetratricopeptide (TPR) repeat protein